jgi:hypothetical protein
VRSKSSPRRGSERRERCFREQRLGRSVTDAEVGLALGVALQAVRVRTLDAVHPARVLGLDAAEEAGGRAAVRPEHEVGHLQRVQVLVLGVGDLRLAAEAEALHGDAVRRIDVGADHERPVVGQHLVGVEDVGGGADFAAAEPIFRHAEQEEQVLHQADAGALGEDGEDVEAKVAVNSKPGRTRILASKRGILAAAPSPPAPSASGTRATRGLRSRATSPRSRGPSCGR